MRSAVRTWLLLPVVVRRCYACWGASDTPALARFTPTSDRQLLERRLAHSNSRRHDRTRLKLDDLDDLFQAGEVLRVSCVDRQPLGCCCCCDEQVERTPPPALATSGRYGREEPPVHPGGLGVERQRLEGRLAALQALLTARSLG